jgi:ABC-type Fe3+/spermidine/putrescine transport system ATPase subunit
MASARIAQIGAPAEIYECPRTEFVARFVGEVNILGGQAAGRSGGRVAVRPEWMTLCTPTTIPAGVVSLRGSVQSLVYLGETIHVHVAVDEGEVVKVALRNEGQLSNPIPWKTGDQVAVTWRPEDAQELAAE